MQRPTVLEDFLVNGSGTGDDYDGAILWLQKVFSDVKRLAELAQSDSNFFATMLYALGYAFHSSSKQVVLWACRLYTRLFAEANIPAMKDTLAKIDDWFSDEFGGLDAMTVAHQHHAEAHSTLFTVIDLHASRDYSAFYNQNLRRRLPTPKEYIIFVHEFQVRPFVRAKQKHG